MAERENYWQKKISLFLHDPVHKILKIQGHESRAEEIAELLHQSAAPKDQYQYEDMVASGLTRAAVPGYSTDDQNGAVDFMHKPELKHPLVKNASLKFMFTESKSVEAVHDSMLQLLKTDLGMGKSYEQLSAIPKEERPLNGFFDKTKTPDQWAKALYFYLFFAFKKRLRMTNTAGLGGLWDLLPADSRIPDHSIWHHCALTSAVGSSIKGQSKGNISLAVFSISPVQPFIAKAKKLRDSWTASVILSYLSFIGIKTVMNELGPDHVVYPSLHDQSLVENWLKKEFHLERFLVENEVISKHYKNSKSIASFPNKFVYLCNTSSVEEFSRRIQNAVQEEWLRIAGAVRDRICSEMKAGEKFRSLYDNQISDYWQYSWVATKFVSFDEENLLEEILPKSKWKSESDTVHAFAEPYKSKAAARLYGTTHSLVQSLLASSKLKSARLRKSQEGEKCPLCGEHEVLHDCADVGRNPAADYKKAVAKFWEELRSKQNSSSQIGENERLCAVCTTKRFLPIIMEIRKEELLHDVFTGDMSFPSTTELAAQTYIKKLTGEFSITTQEYKWLLEILHEAEIEGGDDEHSRAVRKLIEEGKKKKITFSDRDKYYAVLLMDGDKMGDLVNGKTLDATWGDILHSELSEKFRNDKFNPESPLRKVGLTSKRTVNPAVHAAISDSLNSFSRFGVAPVIHRSRGRLVYAGGDDVCAVLPLDTALEAAEKISEVYRKTFVAYNDHGAYDVSEVRSGTGRIAFHLGNAERISISGALIIAHHKEPLREVLRDAHSVLDGVAKKKKGRNALAIRLKKRSGGDRDIAFKWNTLNEFCSTEENANSGKERIIDSFKLLMQSVTNEEASSSLIYRLENLKEVVRPLVKTEKKLEENREKITKLFLYEVNHSGIQIKGGQKEVERKKREMAARLAALCIQGPASEPEWFNSEGPVIGRFLAPRKEDER